MKSKTSALIALFACAGAAFAQTPEVQVAPPSISTTIHFDWGRDGVYCASCNFGQGNARFTWSDQSGNLWVGHLDPSTGAWTPPAGDNELVDTSAYSYQKFGDGPIFAFSSRNGQVVSQIVYSRWPVAAPTWASVAFATPVASGWSAQFFPGVLALQEGGKPLQTGLPYPSQCSTDSAARALYFGQSTPQEAFAESLAVKSGTAPVLLPFGSSMSSISGGKPGARWVPCTHQLVFAGAAPPDGSGNVYQQVFWYNMDTGQMQQLTTDPNQHAEAFMFRAPEFNDRYVLYTVINGLTIQVYLASGLTAAGAPQFQLISSISSADSSEPYIDETEPFIHCTPACHTWIFMKLHSSGVSTRLTAKTNPNGLAITNIDPRAPDFRILVAESTDPAIQRNNPQYYITAQGPYIYYARNKVKTDTSPFQPLGHFYVDTGLGPPSGPCVGSSAEGGLLPGC